MIHSSPRDSPIQPPGRCFLSFILCLFTRHRLRIISKIAVLGCKNSLKHRFENFHRIELGGAAPFTCRGGGGGGGGSKVKGVALRAVGALHIGSLKVDLGHRHTACPTNS